MMRNQPTDKFIHIDKLQLHYLEWGNEQAQSMVLLHGIGDNAHIWDHFALTKHPVILEGMLPFIQ
jgi:pimeloyl-ACP methyl ester carboxylesterase